MSERKRKCELRLYLSKTSPLARKATENLAKLLQLNPGVIVKVVDVRQQPALARRDDVLATPCLIRISPTPRLRIVGTFNDLSRVARLFGLQEGKGKESKGLI